MRFQHLEELQDGKKSSATIWIVRLERVIVCKAGEVTCIESKEYCGEGLLSPDVVNEKNVLLDE